MTDAMLSRYVAIMIAGTSSQNLIKIAANDIDMIPVKRTTTVFVISTPCGFTDEGSNLAYKPHVHPYRTANRNVSPRIGDSLFTIDPSVM